MARGTEGRSLRIDLDEKLHGVLQLVHFSTYSGRTYLRVDWMQARIDLNPVSYSIPKSYSKNLKLFESVPSKNKGNKEAPKFKSEKVKELQELVEYHQHLYYNKQPKISDEKFDLLWDELKTLDPNNEVFSKVKMEIQFRHPLKKSFYFNKNIERNCG